MGRAYSTNGEKMNAYTILVGKPEGKRPLGKPRRRWEDNIRMDLRERLGKNVTPATNTHATIGHLLDTSFSMRSVWYQRKVGDYFFPELLVFFSCVVNVDASDEHKEVARTIILYNDVLVTNYEINDGFQTHLKGTGADRQLFQIIIQPNVPGHTHDATLMPPSGDIPNHTRLAYFVQNDLERRIE
jgi:hypothetical protein